MRWICLLPIILIGCGAVPSVVDQSTVSEEYIVDGGFWSEGSTIRVYAGAEPRDGLLAVCGAWAVDQSSALTIGFHHRVMSGGLITLDDRTILMNLLFMNEIRADANPAGQFANCASTGAVWEQGMEGRIGVRIPRRTFGGHISSDEQRLTFRQGRITYPF